MKKRDDRIAKLQQMSDALLLVLMGIRPRTSLYDIIQMTEITEEPEGVKHD